MFHKVLVTGSCGLVGSEASLHFMNLGATVLGIDNNSRKKWFGKEGDVAKIQEFLCRQAKGYMHFSIDVTSPTLIDSVVRDFMPDLVIHCAGQPSHEKSAEIPRMDFVVNAQGTINILEAVRVICPEVPFIFVSTNKVYGDRPNALVYTTIGDRYILTKANHDGIDETMPIDTCLHSPFGASKAAADIMVQEYGQYYGMKTVCFRCGCITGANHQGVEQHGFLSHLCLTAKRGEIYTIYGHKGKQVRDNIHVHDLVQAFELWAQRPGCGDVYNMGGGFDNSCSVLEAIKIIESRGSEVKIRMGPERKGDHLCYYTNFTKFRRQYPQWSITRSLHDIFEELLGKIGD